MATAEMSSTADPAEPKVLPLIGSVTRSGIVVIEIGSDRQQHHVHEELLSHHSEYFRKAFNGSWKESEDKRVALTDVDPIAFDIFVQWLYTQKLPTYLEYRNMAKALPPTLPDDDDWITALTKSLVFGDRFLVPVFSQTVNNLIVDNILGNAGYLAMSPPFFTATKYAYENLPEDHIIHEFFLEVHCRYWEVESYAVERTVSETLQMQVPPNLLVEMMVLFACKATEGTAWRNVPLDVCHYHMHADDEERKQCEIDQREDPSI